MRIKKLSTLVANQIAAGGGVEKTGGLIKKVVGKKIF